MELEALIWDDKETSRKHLQSGEAKLNDLMSNDIKFSHFTFTKTMLNRKKLCQNQSSMKLCTMYFQWINSITKNPCKHIRQQPNH